MATLVGIFEASDAEKVLNALHRNGFGDETLRVLDGRNDKDEETPVEGEVNPGLIVPATAGQVGSGQIGVNPLAALSLDAMGADGLGDSFNGLGMADEETRVFHDAVKNGGTVIILQVDADKIAQARSIFKQFNGSGMAEANTGNTARTA